LLGLVSREQTHVSRTERHSHQTVVKAYGFCLTWTCAHEVT
jgi:hypothetical protein